MSIALSIGGSLVSPRLTYADDPVNAAPDIPALVCDADCWFAQGYQAEGGPAQYLEHLLRDVRPCEGNWYVAYANGYRSALQFSLGSWATAASATGWWDDLDPYAIGVNTAWWINHIADPGSSSGWPTCWWRGVVP